MSANVVNYYRCPRCHHQWDEEGHPGETEECPECREKGVAPYCDEDPADWECKGEVPRIGFPVYFS